MLLWYFLLGSTFGAALTNGSPSDIVPKPSQEEEDSFYPSVEWSDPFDWQILTALSPKSGNVLVSPASLKLVLWILYEGASGATQREFESELSFISKSNIRGRANETIDSLQVNPASGNKLSLSTKIFLDSKITAKESFTKRVKDYYHTDIEATNFSDTHLASNRINAWAAQSSLGAISKLTEPDELQDMIMLLANTIFFKGVWRHPFPQNATRVAGFYAAPQSKIYVPFMTTTNMFYYYESDVLRAKILRLPYKGSRFSMFLMLPYALEGLESLLENINFESIHRQLHYLDKRLVLVSIPKFSFKLKASYAEVLQQCGLRKVFQNSASFTGIAQGNSAMLRQLVVSDILQTTGIVVDEEGTVAYAATDVIIGNKIGVHEEVFNASHPFLFFVQDDITGIILFLGKVENPSSHEFVIVKPSSNEA